MEFVEFRVEFQAEYARGGEIATKTESGMCTLEAHFVFAALHINSSRCG